MFDGVIESYQKHVTRAGSFWTEHLHAVQIRVWRYAGNDPSARGAVASLIARSRWTKLNPAIFRHRFAFDVEALVLARERLTANLGGLDLGELELK